MDKIRVGVVGLGQRGSQLLETLMAIKDVEIVALCDAYEDRVEKAFEIINKKTGLSPNKYTDFDSFINDKKIFAIVIASSWDAHIKMAIKSMKAGKYTAMEVGGAETIEECYDLVEAYEKTKTPFMLLENCCFDRFELLSTKLVREGLLGEIVHCHGAYSHDLRYEVLSGNVARHYRLKNYINRNCENYPTHELGPMAKILNINRGNKFTKLVSVSSKAVGLEEFSYSDNNPDKALVGQKFKQGDIIDTIITCENGETITLTLDTTLPKYYSREFTVRGTKGLTNQESNMVMIEGRQSFHDYYNPEKTIAKYLNNADQYADYLPDFWQNITEEQRQLGHGGMDYFMLVQFVKAIKEGKEMPIDVYDAASWMCITALSDISIRESKVVEVPDFTNGKYKNREKKDVIVF